MGTIKKCCYSLTLQVKANQRSGQYPSLFGCIQVPELDVSVSCSDKVAAVLGEGDSEHPAGHFVGGNDRTFLLTHKDRKTKHQFNIACKVSVPVWHHVDERKGSPASTARSSGPI